MENLVHAGVAFVMLFIMIGCFRAANRLFPKALEARDMSLILWLRNQDLQHLSEMLETHVVREMGIPVPARIVAERMFAEVQMDDQSRLHRERSARLFVAINFLNGIGYAMSILLLVNAGFMFWNWLG
jgi:hypothetical protein